MDHCDEDAQQITATEVGLSPNYTTIENIVPLEIRPGKAEPKNIPDALDQIVFGNGDLLNRQTFVILDAAKVVNLVEMLETSGLEHCCLFKGAAYDELKVVAPWLVRLEKGNSFTRRIFVKSDQPWDLWDSEPGVFIRSTWSLEELKSHFRKFTKVSDETGKWYYFRFWESSQIPKLFNDPALEPILCKLCSDNIMIWRHSDTAYSLKFG